MNELRRIEYLEAMGIASYVPRFVVPAAKASVQLNLPKVEPIQPAAEDALAPPLRTHRVARDISQLIDSPSASKASLAEGRAATKNEIPPPQEESPQSNEGLWQKLRFVLHFWQVDQQLFVIDSHMPRQALPTQALLNNMLIAVQKKIELRTADSLEWPIPGVASGTLVDAREMVSSFLQGRIGEGKKMFWLMGESAFKVVASGGRPDTEAYKNALGHLVDLPLLDSQALVLPSLTELLKRPLLKRPVWQALQNFYL